MKKVERNAVVLGSLEFPLPSASLRDRLSEKCEEIGAPQLSGRCLRDDPRYPVKVDSPIDTRLREIPILLTPSASRSASQS